VLLFYFFFEASLVPMFFLIGIWGGERRIYAATKFFIYTAVGSLLMLAGIITIYFFYQSSTMSRFWTPCDKTPANSSRVFGIPVVALAFFIKVPCSLFTPGYRTHILKHQRWVCILAGVLLKMGTYGLMRFNLTLFQRHLMRRPGSDCPRCDRHYLWRAGGNGST